MAPLGGSNSSGLPAVHVQLFAIGRCRWRMFVNNFRRQRAARRHPITTLLYILLYLVLWPILGLAVIGPIVGSGIIAWLSVDGDHPQALPLLLAGIFLLWQIVAINGFSVAAAISSFDPSSLLRFPIPFPRYVLLRTWLGFFTPSTICGCLALASAGIGIGAANHALILPAFAVMVVFALMNIFFTRMLSAWFERWLAARRFREIFGALTLFFFLGVQFLNLQSSSSLAHHSTRSWLLDLLRWSSSFMQWLPPGFAAQSILTFRHTPLMALEQLAALVTCTAVFLAVYAVRLRKQFLGEFLSEFQPTRRSLAKSTAPASNNNSLPQTAAAHPIANNSLAPIFVASLRKEWIYLSGNVNQLAGMLSPLLFVGVMSRGVFARHPSLFLPGAIGYSLMTLLIGLYNIFGADGSGVQLYLLAPIRFRDVILAKNITSLTLLLAEAILTWLIVAWLGGNPIPFPTQVATGCWTIFVIAANLTVGTMRSIQAPRRFVPGQTRKMRPAPANRTSNLIAFAVYFGSLLLQIPVILLCRQFHQPWLATLIFAPLALTAILGYTLLLNDADQLILSYRDTLAEELCKA